MKNLSGGSVLPPCRLAHELVDQLSVIIGNCDLAAERTTANSEGAKFLGLIRENARTMILTLSRHQCELDKLMCSAQAGQEHVLNEVKTIRSVEVISHKNAINKARSLQTERSRTP